MAARKLDTSTGAGGAVAVARTQFDDHLNNCPDCTFRMCTMAEGLWRTVCLIALRESGRQAVTS